MKTLSLLVLAVSLTVGARAAEAVPLFNATFTMGKEHRFVLISPAGKASPFLGLGEKFEGYTLKAYDPKTSTLDLERDGKITQVTLVGDAAVVNGGAPAATKASVADAEELFRTMRFDEMMSKVLEGQKKAMGPAMQQGMAQAMARANVNLSEEDKAAFTAMQTKVLDDTLGVITSPEMKVAMAKIYSDVFTKEELNSMAAFYATPGGQALVDKQPDVQQKMMGVMMPMIMKNQQGAQQKMAAFMNELKAKYAPGGAGAAPTPAPAPAK